MANLEISSDMLYAKHNKLSDLKEKTYNNILNRCCKVIESAANSGELMCIYEIPKLVFGTGYPTIDIEPCADYVRHKIEKANKNIRTAFEKPNIILICWTKIV